MRALLVYSAAGCSSLINMTLSFFARDTGVKCVIPELESRYWGVRKKHVEARPAGNILTLHDAYIAKFLQHGLNTRKNTHTYIHAYTRKNTGGVTKKETHLAGQLQQELLQQELHLYDNP